MRTRRDVLTAAAVAAFAPLVSTHASGQALAAAQRRGVVKPARLQPGDTVGLVIPSSANWDATEVDILLDALKVLGLTGKLGTHVFDRRGYFAGRDEDRAADINAMFADPAVKAIHCIRGGWGAARLLPLLDWDTIAKHPKILQGYSDITALLLSMHHKTGLVTFHGPNGASVWNTFNLEWMKRVTWNAEQATFRNLAEPTDAIVQTEHRTRVITKGTARGKLLGGNLTVLTAILGSPYVPDFAGSILFIEDVQEAPYRIDRMLTQLSLAGILTQVRGVVWGTCSRCDPGEGFGSLTIPDVLIDHIGPLGVPAFHGAMIGHVDRQFTLPVGVEVEIDASAGTLRMLEPAVV
jgi:muramoyltetrapeptide carboxypeptidase